MGQGPTGAPRPGTGRPAAQQNQQSALERNKDWSKTRFGTIFQLCPTCAPTPEAQFGSQGATRRLPARPRGCPACSTLFESSQCARPKRLAQALQPPSPHRFSESCSRGAPLRPVPLPARSAPGHSHSPRGAPGRGAAAAAGGEPRSGRVRQGGRCSPRGGAAPSGRAPARGGGSCNSGSGGRVCPEQWGEGGAGRGRSGAGTGERADPTRTRERAAAGAGTGGRGDAGAPHVRGAAFPRPPPVPPALARAWIYPPTFSVCGLPDKKLPEAP